MQIQNFNSILQAWNDCIKYKDFPDQLLANHAYERFDPLYDKLYILMLHGGYRCELYYDINCIESKHRRWILHLEDSHGGCYYKEPIPEDIVRYQDEFINYTTYLVECNWKIYKDTKRVAKS